MLALFQSRTVDLVHSQTFSGTVSEPAKRLGMYQAKLPSEAGDAGSQFSGCVFCHENLYKLVELVHSRPTLGPSRGGGRSNRAGGGGRRGRSDGNRGGRRG
ncbi:unnamed protein product [Protopolystoma xenopodis]|uniref:Uncharacterized protein n=1 Tax=Protopolystoma xenopodis TaxID=117903 RepID=A0A3S5CUV5_9PLAT|nr:unnamed protein product [Protopolystoma xenopodis]